ncbi:MAG: hypothetical protein M3Z28_07050 [Candidatus Dormibacteraeota bacterium]|nr:hypothetical protein [Candidatus Dormibacteraeota bacterium]
MILYLPAALFLASLLIAYGSAGRRRPAATIGTVVAAGWSLALLVDPGSAAWVVGPIAATALLLRPGTRVNSTFEGLMRRVTTIAGALLAALLIASRLPIGENPLLLSVVPWFLGALGAAWFASPIDEPERLQGQVLMVASAAAVILASVPAGPVTAGAAGAMALMPLAGERWRLPGSLRLPVSVILLMLAAAAVLVAGIGPSIARIVLFDLSVNVSGAILLATAVLLVAGAALTPIGSEWAALLGVLAVSASAPSLRWAALGGLLAVATVLAKGGEHLAWIAFGILGLTAVLQTTVSGARLPAVALGLGLVFMVLVARAGLVRALVLPATGFLVILTLGAVSSPNLVRFQWIAALGAMLLVARMLVVWLIERTPPSEIVRDQLLLALLLLAISAHDLLGLGALAAALLLVDLAIVRIEAMPERWSAAAGRLVLLARSNWPPAVTFAAASMAVIAALQASLALGLLAALLLAGLQLAPLLDGQRLAPASERPRSALGWVGPVLSIACGLAPALLLRMLRL